MSTFASLRRMRPNAPRSPVTAPGSAPDGSGDDGAPAGKPPRSLRQLRRQATAHWALVGVVLVYVLAALLVVPVLAPVAISDDWQYARSVEILLQEGRLQILPFSAANAFFQLLWGGLFAAVFGMSFGILRVATVVLVGVSGLALYGLLRNLAIGRAAAALGVALYLFNPIAYAISFTFMTDPYFLGLLVISAFCFVRAVRDDHLDARWLVAGAVVSSLAYLARQQGLLVPLAVLSYLILTRRLRWNRRGMADAARILAVPILINGAFYLWLRFVNGIPPWNQEFITEVVSAGLADTALLVSRMTFITAMYLGLFLLPVAVAAVPRLRLCLRTMSTPRWLGFAAGTAVIAIGLFRFSSDGRRMPYIPHFFHRSGLGANDLFGTRELLGPPAALWTLTALCALSFLVVLFVVCASIGVTQAPHPGRMGLVWMLLAWMALGALLPSFEFRNWRAYGVSAPSLDRYLLPLLPLAIAIVLRLLSRVAPRYLLAWLVLVPAATFAVVGTRDSLVMQQAIWDFNREATVDMGIPQERFDGGASWGGYHLAEYSYEREIPVQTEDPPWWQVIWATATDSTYVVSTSRSLDGYEPIAVREYSQWLWREPMYLYLLKREGAPLPGAA